MVEEESGFQEVKRKVMGEAKGGLEGVGLEREEGAREGWERGMKDLGELKGITEVVARLERAKEVIVVLEGK